MKIVQALKRDYSYFHLPITDHFIYPIYVFHDKMPTLSNIHSSHSLPCQAHLYLFMRRVVLLLFVFLVNDFSLFYFNELNCFTAGRGRLFLALRGLFRIDTVADMLCTAFFMLFGSRMLKQYGRIAVWISTSLKNYYSRCREMMK